MNKWLTLVSLLALTMVFSAGIADAAGTLKVTFKFKDTNGVDQPLSYAYVYLRNAATDPPRERFFSPADYILGPSDASGRITASVPEGNYYIRLTRRNSPGNQGSSARPLGPPETGDYTWNQTSTITISANATIDLGTKYASFFAYAPITISGTVKSYAGAPLAGRYVKATVVPCTRADYSSQDPSEWHASNQCGPEKHLALQRTDANGNYTLFLKSPGTYYLYESMCLGDQHQQYSGNACMGVSGGSVTVNVGDNKTVNIVGN